MYHINSTSIYLEIKVFEETMAKQTAEKIREMGDHPLKASEETFAQREMETNLQMLRRNNGIAQPMKIMMEMQAYQKVGRLPFLPSSRVHLDVIAGRDETIDFNSYLGGNEFAERLYKPHEIADKKLNLN